MKDEQPELRRLKRAYLALGHTTAQLVRATSETELLAAVCKSLVEVGGYRLAWVGYAEGDGIQRVASAGLEADQAYVDGLPFSLSDDALGRGPLGSALRTGLVAVNRDTEHNPDYAAWKERALRYGFRSSVGLPLLSAGQAFGVLSVYAAVPDAFDDDERELLTRLAEGLSFGIESLRTRRTLEATQAELRDANERSRFEILEQSPSAWVAIDREWRFVYVNPQAAQLLGRPADSIKGRVAWELYPQHLGMPMEQAVRRAMETREVVTLVEFSPRTNRWIECRFYPINVGLAGAFTDVTDRRQLEEGLRESELRFRQLAESIDDVFWLTDIQTGKILYVSPAYERIWGRSREDLYASPTEWMIAIHPEDRERVLASLPGQLAGDWEQEYRLLRPDGAIRWIRDRCYLVRDAAGRVHRFAGMARDITDQRLLEEQFRQAQKMEAVGQLAGGIAHDFNNLLSVILSYADLALDADTAGKSVRSDLEEIRRAGERASDLTRQLLAFGRQQMLQPRALDLNKELVALQAMLRRLLGEHIELELRTHPEVAHVFVDPSQMGQIVMNLAVNARDAMPSGGTLKIETSNAELESGAVVGHADVRPGAYVLLAVSDSGVGMDARTRERIFEPFFTTKEKGKGTGLGLSTVFGIVKQSQGHIAVESEPGRGSTFKIYLPRTDRPVEGSGARAETQASSKLHGSETILLVEDDDQVRKLTQTILRGQGYRVLEAGNGVEAVSVSDDYPGKIALLLTDVVMPKMSGKELALRLAPERPEMRVLYVSGYDADSIVHHGVLEHGVAFLQKPTQPKALLQMIRELLDAR